jgi:tRNA A-37 threonylcarbamoyl transferase component Bud32
MTSSDSDENPTRPGGTPADRRPAKPHEPAEPADPDATAAPSPRPGPPGGNARGKPPAKPAGAPGRSTAGAVDPLLGTELGGCRIDAMLGRGAMGAVYKAQQLRLDRVVAVKVIRPELMVDPRMLKRFEIEARLVGRFNSPHVVMVHDVGFEQGVHYLVMEFVQGKNLREHTKLLAGGRLPAAEAIPLLRQACKGLEEAQRLGVLHRDVKPDNLMLTDRGVLKIADFGIAKPTHEDFSMTLTSELIGTPLYMSPEQCQAVELDFRSDMYSLGATFYYLLTGEPPVRASSVYELIQTKTKLAHLCLWKALPELDENHPLSRVVERMTALSREDRYPSYEALLNDLVLVEQGRTIDIPRPRTTARIGTVRPPRRRWPLVAALLLAAAGGGGYAVVRWQQGATGPGATTASADSRLDRARQRFVADGPSTSLRGEVLAIDPPAALAAAKAALVADLEAGLACKGRLDAVVMPTSLELPFADLAEFLQRFDAAARLDGGGAELRRWHTRVVAAARGELPLAALAVAKLNATLAAWQQDRLAAAGDPQQVALLGSRLDELAAARARLLELLPGALANVDRNFPTARLESARQSLRTDGDGGLATSADIRGALAEIAGTVRAPRCASGPPSCVPPTASSSPRAIC